MNFVLAAFRVVVLMILLLLILFLSVFSAKGQVENPARAVVEQFEAAFRMGVTNEDVQMAMTIVDVNGAMNNDRVLRYVIAYGQNGVGNKILTRFEKPVTIRGVAVLTLEDPRGDTQYLYLKSVRKSSKVVATDRKNRFFGTDYSIGDVRMEHLELWTYRNLAEETLEFSTAYGGATIATQRLEAVPAEGMDAYYTRRVLWYDVDRHVLVKEEMYNADGLWKTRTRWDFVSFPIAGNETVLRARFEEMRDHRSNSRTMIEATERRFNQDLPAETFTTRELDRGR